MQIHDSQLLTQEGVNTHSLQGITEKIYCEGSFLKDRQNSKHKQQYGSYLHIPLAFIFEKHISAQRYVPVSVVK